MDSKQADSSRRDGATRIGAKLTALARRAEAVIVFERVWPPLVWAATLVALFLAVVLVRPVAGAPRAARIGGVAAFAVALRRRRSRRSRGCGGPAAPRPSPGSIAIPARRIAPPPRSRTGSPWPATSRPPRRCGRCIATRLARQVERFVAAAAGAGHGVARSARAALRRAAARRSPPRSSPGRSATAASPPPSTGATAPAAAATARLDAWIDPPAYTNKPPILLDLAASREAVAEDRHAGRLGAGGARRRRRVRDAGRGRHRAGRRRQAGRHVRPDRRRRRGAPIEKRWTIAGDGAVVFRRDGATLGRFEIEATPLGAPTVTLLEPPRGNLSGSLTLHYSLADRYGIAERRGRVRQARPPAPRRRASLVAPPKLTLRLPSTANGTGEASTTGDLSEHPWAGAEVVMTLKATGVSGKVGAGAPTTFALPQRKFHNPLARALVEQRRALDPRPRPRAAARRQGDRRADDRARPLPDAGRRLSRPAPGARAARRRARRRRPARGRRPVVGDGAADSRTATPRRRSGTCAPPSSSCARRCNAARATRSCAS